MMVIWLSFRVRLATRLPSRREDELTAELASTGQDFLPAIGAAAPANKALDLTALGANAPWPPLAGFSLLPRVIPARTQARRFQMVATPSNPRRRTLLLWSGTSSGHKLKAI